MSAKSHDARTLAGTGALVLAALLLAGTTPLPTGTAETPAAPAIGAPSGAVSDHVVVISVDGLRPDAIEEYDAGTIQRLMREGSYSLEAQTILPSRTLPSHTSMLTGEPPERHGVTWNKRRDDVHGVVQIPTVFELARESGLRTAAFFSKAKFHHLIRPNSLDHWDAPRFNIGARMATRTIPAVATYLQHRRPNLLFVHIAEPDYAGHAFGWMSFVYGMAVERADGAVARVLEAADHAFGRGEYTVILTADHGGHGRHHGSEDPRDTTIPWIVWGEGVVEGGRLEAGIRTMDTAATTLWLLGVPSGRAWAGEPVPAAFTAAAQAAASAELDAETRLEGTGSGG